jgi:hypothetical protein
MCRRVAAEHVSFLCLSYVLSVHVGKYPSPVERETSLKNFLKTAILRGFKISRNFFGKKRNFGVLSVLKNFWRKNEQEKPEKEKKTAPIAPTTTNSYICTCEASQSKPRFRLFRLRTTVGATPWKVADLGNSSWKGRNILRTLLMVD